MEENGVNLTATVTAAIGDNRLKEKLLKMVMIVQEDEKRLLKS